MLAARKSPLAGSLVVVLPAPELQASRREARAGRTAKRATRKRPPRDRDIGARFGERYAGHLWRRPGAMGAPSHPLHRSSTIMALNTTAFFPQVAEYRM